MAAPLPSGFRTQTRELLLGVIRQIQQDFPEVSDMTIAVTLDFWLSQLKVKNLAMPTRRDDAEVD